MAIRFNFIFLSLTLHYGKSINQNIHTLYQVGEDFPSFVAGSAMKTIPTISNAFLALEDGVIVAYGRMEDWEESLIGAELK